MPVVESVIKDPLWGLLNVYPFWVLVAVAAWAVWSRRLWPRVIAVTLTTAIVMYRESGLDIFLRIMVEKTGPGKMFSQDEFAGARLMWDYCHRTSLYVVGSAALLSVLGLVWRTKKPDTGGANRATGAER
jgi:hypothetical protein